MVVMRGHRSLEQAPGLVNFQHADDVGSNRSGVVTAAKRAKSGSTASNAGSASSANNASTGNNRSSAKILDASLIIGDLILHTNRSRHAVAELGGVNELVHTRDRAATTDETVEVVAGIVGPGSAERRDGLTHREASELDEGVVHADRTAGNRACVSIVRRGTERGRPNRFVNSSSGPVPCVGARRPAEGRIEEGTDNAILGRGACINGEVFTRTPSVAIGKPVFRTAGARCVTGVVGVRVDHHVNAQITT